jgi:hypothetical protein
MNRLVEKIFRILSEVITSVVRADHAEGRHIIFRVTVDHICVRYTGCGRKVMRLVMLCTNRQCCCLPLHMAVGLTPAVDPVQV